MTAKRLKEKKNKNQRMLIGTVAVVFLVIIICTIFTGKDSAHEKKLIPYEPDRIQKLDDSTEKVFFTIDPNNEEKSSLVFYTNHQCIEVTADGTEIYSLNYTGGIGGHTTGCVWNFVKLPKDAKQIEVHLTPCYPEVTDPPVEYYIGSGNEIYSTILRQSLLETTLSVFILLAGILITFYWLIIHKSSQIDGTLLYLGVFSILLGLWSANETDASALIILNRQASSIAAFAILMIMPIPFIMFVKTFLEIKDEKFWKIICNINRLVVVISYVLNFTGIYEFRRSLWMTHMVIVLMLIYMFVVMVSKIAGRQVDQRFRACIGALALIFVGTIVDVVGYYKSSKNAGVFGKFSFLIFITVLGIESAKQTFESLNKARRIAELEQFALNDSMTGLYNRNAYNYFVNNEENLENHMIVTFDLNNLKTCNDNYGHSVGDAYIIHSAHIIENIFERFGKCYRIGGDEFCCIIPKAEKFNIEHLVQKLHQEVEILNNKNIIPTKVNIACGYAFFTSEDADIEKVRERADEMMYRNKKKLKGLQGGKH